LKIDQVCKSIELLNEKTDDHHSDSWVAIVFEGTFNLFSFDQLEEDIFVGKLAEVPFELFPLLSERRHFTNFFHLFY
jgi:hypothetical protein